MSIVLYGATGFTGRLAAAALAADGADLTVAGRDARAVDALATRLGCQAAAARADAGELGRAFAGASVVVSCAGPYALVGRTVAEAAIAAGAHYVDATGEPAFMRVVLSEIGPRAAAARVCAVTAGGFDYLPGDLAATLLRDRLGPLRTIDYVYRTGGRSSAGTRRSALEVLRQDAPVVRNGRMTEERPFAAARTFDFVSGPLRATVLPFGDPLLARHRLDIEEATAWGLMPGVPLRALRVALPVLRGALRTPAARMVRATSDRLGDPQPDGSAAARFTIRVEATSRDGRSGFVELHGRDPYAFTARALALRARSLTDGTPVEPGARTPAEGLDARAVIAQLGLTLDEGPSE